jgi:hypothetical protein
LNLTAPKISFNFAEQQLHMNGDDEYDDDNSNGETTC